MDEFGILGALLREVALQQKSWRSRPENHGPAAVRFGIGSVQTGADDDVGWRRGPQNAEVSPHGRTGIVFFEFAADHSEIGIILGILGALPTGFLGILGADVRHSGGA